MKELAEELTLETGNDAKVACVILADTSSSMSGEPITQLNEGLRILGEQLLQDSLAKHRVDLSIVSFGGAPSTVQPFVEVPEYQAPTLTIGGATPMGAGILHSLQLVEEREALYRQNATPLYYPWIFLITDGHPTDNINLARQRLLEMSSAQKLNFWAIGTETAHVETLKSLTCEHNPPMRLGGLHFGELFAFISQSLTTVAHSTPGTSAPIEGPTPGGNITFFA